MNLPHLVLAILNVPGRRKPVTYNVPFHLCNWMIAGEGGGVGWEDAHIPKPQHSTPKEPEHPEGMVSGRASGAEERTVPFPRFLMRTITIALDVLRDPEHNV